MSSKIRSGYIKIPGVVGRDKMHSCVVIYVGQHFLVILLPRSCRRF